MRSKQANIVGPRGRLQANTSWQVAFRQVKEGVRPQLPGILAIAGVGIFISVDSYDSGAYSLVALIFLTAVMYTAMYHGKRHALIAATVVVLYNTASLMTMVAAFSLKDSHMRRIVLMAVVLPAVAFIVGRLKERNDRLLEYEKKARVKAEESENRLRFMAESLPQKIFTANPRGKIDYFNSQWLEYTGLSHKDMLLGDWTKSLHPDDVEDYIARWRYSLNSGEPFAFEHRLHKRDGTYRWHISRAHAMRDDQGKILKWMGSSTDIHDIKLALQREQALEVKAATLAEQREQLIALNRAKDEFISLSSHQLRTPATGVKQYLGMVLEGYVGSITEDQRAYLEQAYESNERQVTIINDLLRVARVDAGKVILRKEKSDIIALIRDVLSEQATKFAEHDQRLVFEPEQDRLTAPVDKANLRMVLENIIDNASKYTPRHKTIEVSVTKQKDLLVITIRDEGVGIAKEDIHKIFNKFSRLDNPLSVTVGGSGLGLYWAKKIIDLHGGTIRVTSQINKGTTFTISLPV